MVTAVEMLRATSLHGYSNIFTFLEKNVLLPAKKFYFLLLPITGFIAIFVPSKYFYIGTKLSA
jgi:hypothetical protein